MSKVDLGRRGMLQAGVAVGGVSLTAGARAGEFAGLAKTASGQRALDVYLMREAAARAHLLEAFAQGPQGTNNDEVEILNAAANYTKGLQHDSIGEVDAAAYRALLAAVRAGTFAAFDAVPLANGAQVKLANPMAAYCIELHGTDSAATRMRPAPSLRSAESGRRTGRGVLAGAHSRCGVHRLRQQCQPDCGGSRRPESDKHSRDRAGQRAERGLDLPRHHAWRSGWPLHQPVPVQGHPFWTRPDYSALHHAGGAQ